MTEDSLVLSSFASRKGALVPDAALNFRPAVVPLEEERSRSAI